MLGPTLHRCVAGTGAPPGLRVGRRTDTFGTVVRKHRRFELVDVTLHEIPIGSATIDVWEDDEGRDQWSARVLMKVGHAMTDGRLIGSTRNGERLSGEVRVADGQLGPRGPRTVLVELHGQGPLEPHDATQTKA
jgi:hypothetical protein